jgi:RND family efflux transporter MFP subunit
MRYAILAVIFAAILVAFSCSNEGGGFLDRLLRGGSSVPVTIESVVAKDKAQSVSLPATIEATESINVTIPEDALVDRVFVSEGSAVNAGDQLLKLSEEEVSGRLARLRSDLRDAQNKVERATSILKNRDRLLDEERIDRTQFEGAEADVSSAEAEAEKIRADVIRMESRLANLVIKSPISGVVTKRAITAGTVARAGEALFTIAKVDPAIALFRMAAEEATSVQPGMPVKVRLLGVGADVASGTVSSVDTHLNPEDNSFTVRAAVPNPQGYYKAGMRAVVDLESPRTQRVWLIPEEALIREPRGYFVYTVVKGVAHKVQVIPSQSAGKSIEVSRGLKDDDVVVVRGHDRLSEGSAVDIWGRRE